MYRWVLVVIAVMMMMKIFGLHGTPQGTRAAPATANANLMQWGVSSGHGVINEFG